MSIQEALKNIKKFEGHLITYHKEQNEIKKRNFEGSLDDIMAFIQADLDEVERKGMHKEIHSIEKEYAKYKQSQSDEDYAALEEDLKTIKQFLQEIL